MRLAGRAAKKVGYNDPLTQTITTNKYVKSHIELLIEDSPSSATDPESAALDTLDVTMAYTGNETRDGGQTPGPFEEMRRRMADSEIATPARRKRRSREKKRKWEWTITTAETEEGEQDKETSQVPVTAIRLDNIPGTPIWREASVSTDEASETEGSQCDQSMDSGTESEVVRRGFVYTSQLEMESQDGDRPGTSQSL
jgi:hypothetical protein